MAGIIIAPSKYVQGKGEIGNLAKYVLPLGKKPFVIVSESGLQRSGKALQESFQDVKLVFDKFNGECSKNEINRLLKSLGDCDIIVGVGGGKILDTAKAVAFYAKLPIVIVPTIASTDAPCSALSVIYSDKGEFEEYLFLPSNPNLVVMDTEIITAAPARLLVSGMGDALATYFEARACKKTNSTSCAGGTMTQAAFALAELCYDTLLEEGLKAKLAIERKVCTTAVENIIEASTYLSGIGFESGGLAAAHAIHNGFTVLPECHDIYHGEKVAFGTIAQLVLENSPLEEIEEVIGFCLDVGLPVTLADIGVKENIDEKIKLVAQASCAQGESIYNMPVEITVDKVYAAIIAADELGKYYKGSCCC